MTNSVADAAAPEPLEPPHAVRITPAIWLSGLFVALLASRLCHLRILWTEEDLPMAAALQMIKGSVLYRDVWFDKPPLLAAFYVPFGAEPGLLLRLVDTVWVFLGCLLAWRFARDLWRPREGLIAAGLLGFFLTFGIPAAVTPLAADLLMLVPHLAAVYLAWKRKPVWSGALAGIAFLINSKGMFVLAACLLWQWRALPLLVAGFAIPNLVVHGWLAASGALKDYYTQVWEWGALYAKNTFLENPLQTGLVRTANWLGFQAALVLAAAQFWRKGRDCEAWRMAGWLVLSFVAVLAGWRFFPRYYLQLLPVAVVAGSRGVALMGRKQAVVLVLLLLVPLVRFGPRYVTLTRDLVAGRTHEWRDIAMDQDSQAAAALVRGAAFPGDTLFVWGYRPDIFLYTRMRAGTRFLESQPLNGVFADRHLFQSAPLVPEFTRKNREELVKSRPAFVLDGLSLFNPRLAPGAYPEVAEWLQNYREIGRTQDTIVYRRRPQ